MLKKINNITPICLFEGKEGMSFLFEIWPEIFSHEKINFNIKSYLKVIYLKAQLNNDSYVIDLLYSTPFNEEMTKIKIAIGNDSFEVTNTKNVSLWMNNIHKEYIEVKNIHMASIVSANKSKPFNK